MQSITGFLPACGGDDAKGAYTFRSPDLQARIASNTILYQIQGSEVRVTYAGGNETAESVPGDRMAGVVNFILPGAGPECQSLTLYGSLSVKMLYPGVTLRLDSQNQKFEPEYLVDARSNPALIRIRQTGASEVKIAPGGDLELRTKYGILREKRPQVWQFRHGKKKMVAAAWRLFPDGTAGFALGAYDRELPLVIDPVVSYNTYLANASGSNMSAATATTVDSTGNVYYTGWIEGGSLGLTGLLGPKGSTDAFLMKLSPIGVLLYATYFGGSGDDRALGVTVDSSGRPWITGVTSSNDLPVFNAFQAAMGGYRNAFVAQFSTSGALQFCSYFGGSGPDSGNGITADSTGNVYIVGDTQSSTLLMLQPAQRVYGGGQDAFVAKLNSDGGLVYSTYLGGSFSDHGAAIAVDSAGSAYVTGGTSSPNFPTKAAFQGSLKGTADAFVTKLDANGVLVYSTFLGGSGGTGFWQEQGNAIAVDSQWNAIIAGVTSSTDFPYPAGTAAPVLNGPSDGFVVKLAASGGSLLSTAFLGGVGADVATAVVVDRAGAICVAGYTSSPDFPVSAPIQPGLAGIYDAFVTIYNPAGSAYYFSTFIGGSGIDSANGMAIDGSGNIYLAGQTGSLDYPLVNGLPRSHSGGTAAMAVKVVSDDAYSFVERLYFGVLNGTLDPAGLTSWTNILNQGSQTRAQVALSFFQQPIVQTSGFHVIAAYISVLGRDPDYGGYLYWTTAFRSGNLVPAGCTLGVTLCSQQRMLLFFTLSPEFQTRFNASSNEGFVTVVYQNVLGRPPDPSGYSFWLQGLNNGLARTSMLTDFVNSPEFLTSFGSRIQAGMAYLAFLLRPATPAELQTWTTALNSGTTVASMVNSLISSPEFKAGL